MLPLPSQPAAVDKIESGVKLKREKKRVVEKIVCTTISKYGKTVFILGDKRLLACRHFVDSQRVTALPHKIE